MFKNLIETMSALSDRGGVVFSNHANDVEKVIGIAFMLAYFLMSKFISKFSGLEMSLSLSLVALIFAFAAHDLDNKLPFPNKHFWKIVAVLLMAPVFLLAGV